MGGWQKGQSGNAGGRPRTKLYSQAAREYLAAGGLGSPPDWGAEDGWTKAQRAVAIDYAAAWPSGAPGDGQAANRLLDRAEGKPHSELELGGAIGLAALPPGISMEEYQRIRSDPDGVLRSLLADESMRLGLLGQIIETEKRHGGLLAGRQREPIEISAVGAGMIPADTDGPQRDSVFPKGPGVVAPQEGQEK